MKCQEGKNLFVLFDLFIVCCTVYTIPLNENIFRNKKFFFPNFRNSNSFTDVWIQLVKRKRTNKFILILVLMSVHLLQAAAVVLAHQRHRILRISISKNTTPTWRLENVFRNFPVKFHRRRRKSLAKKRPKLLLWKLKKSQNPRWVYNNNKKKFVLFSVVREKKHVFRNMVLWARVRLNVFFCSWML